MIKGKKNYTQKEGEEVKHMLHSYKVGDIFYKKGENWCCYLVKFFKITRVTDKTVWFVEIEKKQSDKEVPKEKKDLELGFMYLVPNQDKIISEIPIGKRIGQGSDGNRIYSSEKYSFCNSYHNVSYYRYAGEPVLYSDSYHLLR